MVEQVQTAEQEPATEEQQMVDIYVMGKHYRVPADLTIMTALEYCGYRLVRGCGCRAAFCGCSNPATCNDCTGADYRGPCFYNTR